MTILTWIQDFLLFLNGTVVPLIIALAFIFFVWNAFRFFILQSDSEDGREKSKRLALYGISAFVIMLTIWGIVNILVSTFGISRYYTQPLESDFVQQGGGSSLGGGSGAQAGFNDFSCTDLILGFSWCSKSESNISRTPGASSPSLSPNQPRETFRFNFSGNDSNTQTNSGSNTTLPTFGNTQNNTQSGTQVSNSTSNQPKRSTATKIREAMADFSIGSLIPDISLDFF